MGIIKKVWLTFRQLKTWLQILIVFVVISLFGAISGSGSSDSSSNSSVSSSQSSSNTKVSAAKKSEEVAPAVSDVEFKAALSKMRIVKDDVKNLKFYYDKTSPRYVNANGFALYAGQESNSAPYLYLKIQYFGSDWLFINTYFFNIDGKTYEIVPKYGDVETDNDTNVWEWYNQPATSSDIAAIQKIITSKKTVLRLEGDKYYKDVVITQTQKAALKNVLTVFQGLGGKL